jgi:hypothetical protein
MNITTKETRLPSLARTNLVIEKSRSNAKNKKLNAMPMMSNPKDWKNIIAPIVIAPPDSS